MNLRDLFLRVRALVAPRRVERELDEELAFHIERETVKHIDQGLSPADARARARARFGSVPLAADQCRDARGTAFFDTLAQDVRYAFRTFRRAPLAALTVVATVAVGLGLVAVVFTFYNALFLRAGRRAEPGRAVRGAAAAIPRRQTGVWEPWTRADYERCAGRPMCSPMCSLYSRAFNTRIDGRAVSGTLVTGNFFTGVGRQRGARAHIDPGRRQEVRRPACGGAQSCRVGPNCSRTIPEAIGRSVIVNGSPYTVVGVMPPGFHGLATFPPDYWAPLDLVGSVSSEPGWKGRSGRASPSSAGSSPACRSEAATTGLTAWASANPDLPVDRGSPQDHLLETK